MNAHYKNKIRENGLRTFRAKIENSSCGALVLHMTSNFIISRRCQDENGKEMYQNVKYTCRASRSIVFAILKEPISVNIENSWSLVKFRISLYFA